MNLMSAPYEQTWEDNDPPEEKCARCHSPIELPEDEWFAAFEVWIGVPSTSSDAAPNGSLRFPSGVLVSGTGVSYCPTCAPSVALCRMCGCTDEAGCDDGCHWVEVDLCSSCETKGEA